MFPDLPKTPRYENPQTAHDSILRIVTVPCHINIYIGSTEQSEVRSRRIYVLNCYVTIIGPWYCFDTSN